MNGVTGDKVAMTVPMPIKAIPYEHQIRGYDFALEKFKDSKGIAYLMEMGTGKTITTIAVLGALYQQSKINKVLIIAPKSIVGVWKDEFEKFADFEYNLAVLDGASTKKADVIRHMKGVGLQIIVVNYESAWRLEDELKVWSPDSIVCDESTKIKNPQARCSKALHRLGKKSKYNLILTGTPITNSPLDFFSQYKFLDDSIFGGSYYAFRAKHAILGGFQQHQIVGYKNLDELVSKAHSVAYRVKLKDAVDLPPFIDETRLIELEPKAQRIYRNLEKDSYSELAQGEITTRNVLTKLLRLSQLTGGFIKNDEDEQADQISTAKIDALEDIIESATEQGNKVVVFARFIPELRAIERMLRKLGIAYSLISGEVKDRQEQVEMFQTDPNVKVFVGQLQTVGMGLTLTAACVAVFYSLDFNFANYEQSRARIHRIGQDKKCLYIHLVAKGTVDEKVFYALKHKKDVATLVVDDWRTLIKK